MFGYLVADLRLLSEEQTARYKAVYCGLCRTLISRYGRTAGLTLNYDLTFLILLLNSLYESEEASGEEKCIRHPIDAHTWVASEMTEYAADLDLMLARLKCLDNWADDRSLISLAGAKLFEKGSIAAAEKHPRQFKAMKDSIHKLWELENSGSEDIDESAAAFGELMGQCLVYREDRWSGDLYAMGSALGKFIYIMDAVMDLDADMHRGRYNPLLHRYGLDNEQMFRDILKMLLSECVYYFDRLPLVQDTDILKNILCFGLWQQFDAKYVEKGRSDV